MLTYDHGGLILWGHDHFLSHLESAKAWLDRYPSFKIGLENEAYTYDQLAKENPAALDKIRAMLRAYPERFGIGTCTYGQPLSVFIDGESNIRQIAYALRADRTHFGRAPDIYLMSEHAMHSQIPQILQGFGFAGAIMRTHYMMYGYNPTFDLPLGWWVGLDGSRLPTIPTYKGQGAQFGRTTLDNWFLTRYPGDNARQSPADFRRDFGRIQPLLATRADDAGLRREALVREYEGKPGFRWILLEEIMNLYPAPTQPMTTRPNDFTVRMPWGYCGNEIWNQCRSAEVAVLCAERLAALDLCCGGRQQEAKLEEAWKNLLVAQHHDIQICGILADARRFLPASLSASQEVTSSALRHIASRLDSGGGPQVVVFNPMSWSRQAWLEVPVSLPRGYAKDLQLRCGGKPVPCAVLSADLHSDGSLRDLRLALRPELPGLSVSACQLIPKTDSSVPPSNGLIIDRQHKRLETPFVRASFHKQGGLVSLQDQTTGLDYLQNNRRSACFTGVIEGRDVTSQGQVVLKPASGGADWVVARESGLIDDIPYVFDMRFYAHTPRIDCSVRFSFDGQRIGRLSENTRDSYSPFLHEEKLRFKLFPDFGAQATGVRDLPFAVSETQDRYLNGLYWTALADKDKGMALLNRGTMGAVREKDGGFSMPLAYAMYYIWGTRMLSGDFTYEFALYPFSGDWRQADLHRQALDYNFQPIGLQAEAGSGTHGHILQPLSFGESAPVVSALYPRGRDLIIRFFEHQGRTRQVTLQARLKDADLEAANLAEKRLGRASNPLNLTPWQIKTVCIEIGPPQE